MKKWLVAGVVVVGVGVGLVSWLRFGLEDVSESGLVSLLREYRVVGGTISPKVGRDVVYEEGSYVDWPQDEKSQNRLHNTHLFPSEVTNLILEQIVYPFAGMGDEGVSSMYHVAGPIDPSGLGPLWDSNGSVGWVVVNSRFKIKNAKLKMQNAGSEVTNLILDLEGKQVWPGVVLAKREGGKLRVKVAVGVPGVKVGYEGGGPDLSDSSHSARQHKSSLESVPDLSSTGEWIKKPDWWEGEVEFKENKSKIDYVFLGKNWYGVKQVQNFKKSQNRLHNTHLFPSEVTNLILDDEGWVRVGYFPVELGKTIEVRAARKSKEMQGEVWTELVQSAKLKVQNKRSVLERDENGFQNRLSRQAGINSKVTNLILEVWYPVWEGNDLARRGNQDKAKNCDVLKRGKVVSDQRPATSDQRLVNNEVVIYKAEGYGVNCDYIPYERYGGFENYFLIVKGENKEGRSLKIYLHSLENDQRVILEELLPEGKFEKVFPIEVRRGGGMVLNLETRSFGRVASENVIEQVLLVPSEWEWVRRVKMISSDLSGSSPSARQRRDNKYGLDSVAGLLKLGTGVYLVSLRESDQRPATGDRRLLTLSQGYEKGWEAIEVHRSPFAVFRLEQVRVDGWKNGWVLRQAQDEFGDELIIIFYWPQVLEWVGLVGLLWVFIWLWRAH